MTKFSVLLLVPTLLFLTVSDSTVSTRLSQASTATAGEPAVAARGRGNPRILLSDGRDLSEGADGARVLDGQEAGVPLTLAGADFDNDGVPDLAAGYRVGNAGALVLWRGNEDAIHPNTAAAVRRRETGQFLESPFFASRVALETAESPDWLVAGDFDGDGNADLVFASRGSAALHVLPGDGAGGFRPALQRDLPGAITAMAGGTRDAGSGGLGIAVAILGSRGASLLLFDSGFSGSFEAVALPGPATGLAIARLGNGPRPDVVAVAGSELVVAHRAVNAKGPARARVERRSLPFWAAAVTAGHFGTGSREGLAFLAEDGRSYVLAPGEVPAPEDVRQAPAIRAASRRETMAASPAPYLPSGSPAVSPATPLRVADLKDWALTETSGDAAEGGVAIHAARLSGSQADDLLVLDARGRRIDVISPPPAEDAADQGGARSPSAQLFSSSAALEVSGEPVAVLPMRLNEDGVSDLVVLRSGSVTPAVVLSAPALSLTVNSNGDTGDASPGNGICADSNGNCTLRAAIQEANASAGSDTINFAIAGAGVHTITTGSSLPTITGTVTIDGTTQSGYAGTPLIEVKGATGQIGLTIRVSDCVVRGLAVNGYEATGQTGGVGIYIVSSGPLVKNALLEANFIGTDPTGTQSKPNHLGIDFENTSLHTVGGTTAAARNLISGNSLVGIQVIGPGASGNTFQGNYVGTTANGSAALPNAFAGFNLFANNTVVGGAAAGAGNVISGNGGGGLFTSQFCAPSCFGSGTVVTSNRIGTNPAGTAAVGNTTGVLTSSPGSPNTTIANNLISGNPNGGIQIDESLTTVTNITGNLIGTDVTGTLALGNGNNGGILIHTTVATAQINVGGATGTTPGGSCTGSCNLISANSPFGIYAFGSGPVSIVYNFIGTDVTGTQALGNDPGGVVLAAAGKTLGSSATTGNLISGNGTQLGGGFGVLSQSTASPGNTIKGNLIGTTTTGNTALGNFGDGVVLGAFDTLGGSTAADRNVISGNADNGVVIAGATSVSSKVQGNFIGTKKNGSAALANGAEGVLITNSSSSNTIGGVNAGEGNVVAFNAFTGVRVDSGTGNAIEGNSIFSNGALGIDLGAVGVDFNDLGDPDTGANNLQNYPNLASAVSAGGSTTITGSLNSKANTGYRLEFFSSPAADPTAHGEGQTFLGSKDVTTGNDGNAPFTAIFAGTLAPGAAVTATATSPSGDTSEFSCGAGLCQADVSIVKTDTPDPAEAGKELTYTLTVSNAGPSAASGVHVTDPLPSTVNFVSVDASQGTCGQQNKTVTCDLGSIGNGSQATVTIVVVPTKIGKISNTATVTRTEPDPVSSNDSSKADTEVVPTKIVVNTTGDEADLDPSDDICDVDAQTDGSQCTLRAAIQMANAHADLQAIVFDIPGGPNHTITPGSPLPAITDTVLLDATTQPGFSGVPVIELNGAAAGGNGLTLAAGDSTIKGLMINRFSGHGILIQTKGNNVIQGNIIGTNAASAAGLGNGGDGISIDGQSGNTIGALATGGNAPEGARPLAPSSFLLGLSNVIAGNSGRGISILSALGVPDLNKILTNAIGTDFAGKSGIGNALEGIFLQSAIRTTIQNTVVGSSGKCGIAAELKLAAAQQQLQQLNAMMLEMTNSISGAFKTFNSALPREARPKSTEAIQSLFGGFGSIFSGPTVPLGNFLGGLCMEEILSGVANPATTVKILGSLFAANQGPGIAATKTNAIQMLGSMVGTDENGTAGLGNTDGVSLLGSLNSILGDPNFASNLLNVVAGNSGRGIAIQSQAGLISDLNKIFGTYVGTDFNAKTGLGNGQDGVQLMSALRTIVQGSVLAGNGKCGMSADLKLAEAQQQLQQVNGKLVEMINTVSGAHKKILGLIGQRARPASEKIAVNSLFGGIGGVFASATTPLGNFLGGACLEQILTQLPNTSTVLVNLFGSLLAANSGPGVSASNVMGLQMQGSIVGTDENGGTGLGNTDGMLLTGLKNSVLGDPNFAANLLNVVAGNSGRGVLIQSLSGLLSDVNKIFGTYVG
ncbi:MAG TPA: CSLREA domain-containing protein, partial [Thermoanaerobaculia bacterium]|nr:CSLREA domain-containing protein [Thermoanaerobaculia bacterium]